MPFQWTNRRGEVYSLQATLRKGKPHYSFTRKLKARPVDDLPPGHEAFERPEDGQVFLRKIKPNLINPNEVLAVENSIRTLTQLTYFIVRAEGKSIIVYLSDIEPNKSIGLIGAIFPLGASQAESIKQYMESHAIYTKMFRFTLIDAKLRHFIAERWCFLGGIDNWYFLDGDAPLGDMLPRYMPHLGQESFFELM